MEYLKIPEKNYAVFCGKLVISMIFLIIFCYFESIFISNEIILVIATSKDKGQRANKIHYKNFGALRAYVMYFNQDKTFSIEKAKYSPDQALFHKFL